MRYLAGSNLLFSLWSLICEIFKLLLRSRSSSDVVGLGLILCSLLNVAVKENKIARSY